MGLKWDAIPQNEKLKIMDKMLRYIRKNAETIYDKDCPKTYIQSARQLPVQIYSNFYRIIVRRYNYE